MEYQPSLNDSAPFLNAKRIDQSKDQAIFSTVVNFILSIMLAAIFQIRWSRIPIHFGLDKFHEIFVITFLLLLPLLSIISARRLSRWTSPDPVFQRAFMWTILRGISQTLFFTYMILLMVSAMLQKA